MAQTGAKRKESESIPTITPRNVRGLSSIIPADQVPAIRVSLAATFEYYDGLSTETTKPKLFMWSVTCTFPDGVPTSTSLAISCRDTSQIPLREMIQGFATPTHREVWIRTTIPTIELVCGLNGVISHPRPSGSIDLDACDYSSGCLHRHGDSLYLIVPHKLFSGCAALALFSPRAFENKYLAREFIHVTHDLERALQQNGKIADVKLNNSRAEEIAAGLKTIGYSVVRTGEELLISTPHSSQ